MDAQLITDLKNFLEQIRVENDDIESRRKADDFLIAMNEHNQPTISFYGHMISHHQHQEILGHCMARQRIQALRAFRTATGLGLKEAKAIIDPFLDHLHATE